MTNTVGTGRSLGNGEYAARTAWRRVVPCSA